MWCTTVVSAAYSALGLARALGDGVRHVFVPHAQTAVCVYHMLWCNGLNADQSTDQPVQIQMSPRKVQRLGGGVA